MRRRLWWLAGGAAVVVAVVVAIAVWPSGRVLPPPRARVYSDVKACLLTDSLGVGSTDAAPVWAGMESASLKTKAAVSYLPVYGADTVDNASVFVNTLAQRRCNVVVAVGASEVGAVRSRASAFGSIRFLVVGSGASAGNVTAIPVSDSKTVSAGVADAVEKMTGK